MHQRIRRWFSPVGSTSRSKVVRVSAPPIARAVADAIETLESRVMMSATISLTTRLVFNDAIGGSASAAQGATIANTGDQSLTVTNISLAGGDASQFLLGYAPPVPFTLAPGQSTQFYPQFSPQSTGAGIKSAVVNVSSNDPATPTAGTIVRGFATVGTQGSSEPSLQRIFDLYQMPVNVGQANPDNSQFFLPLQQPNDEIAGMQLFTKAGAGPVIMRPLAVFEKVTEPVVRYGFYPAGDPSVRTQLAFIRGADAQTVNPWARGAYYFDPGAGAFGLYSTWPAWHNADRSVREVFSQDALNTFETNTATSSQHMMRWYPARNPDGSAMPNCYVVAVQTITGYYDFNDAVFLMRNIKPVFTTPTPVIGTSNVDVLPGSTRLVFNRTQQANPDLAYANVVHDTDSLIVRNTGDANLNISSIAITADGTDFKIISGPTGSTTLTPGQSTTVQVRFVGQTGDRVKGKDYFGTLSIFSNDPLNPTKNIALAGHWQSYPNQTPRPGATYNEPSLQNIVNDFGYTTDVGQSKLNTGSKPIAVGEEVLSSFWAAADSSQAVNVRQLAAFHGPGGSYGPALRYYNTSFTVVSTPLFRAAYNNYQTFVPAAQSGSTPSTTSASFTATGAFGFQIDGFEWNDDTKNGSAVNGGHDVRMYPLRNSSGAYIPNTWLMVLDYSGGSFNSNYDYQDNVYVISNAKPSQAPGTVMGLGSVASPGDSSVFLNWSPNPEPDVTSYRIYRSTTNAGAGFSLVGSTGGTVFRDTGANVAGRAYYYRVTAVNAAGYESTAGQAQLIFPTAYFTGVDIGSPSPGGATTVLIPNSAYRLDAGGSGIGGTSDSFHYAYTTLTGDFDIVVHVAALVDTGASNLAALMVRSSLAANSANVTMGAGPVGKPYQFSYRASDGTQAISSGSGATSYPYVWVRLQRVGNTFNGYLSVTGSPWSAVGTVNLNLPSTVYFGMALTSGNNGVSSATQFDNYKPFA